MPGAYTKEGILSWAAGEDISAKALREAGLSDRVATLAAQNEQQRRQAVVAIAIKSRSAELFGEISETPISEPDDPSKSFYPFSIPVSRFRRLDADDRTYTSLRKDVISMAISPEKAGLMDPHQHQAGRAIKQIILLAQNPTASSMQQAAELGIQIIPGYGITFADPDLVVASLGDTNGSMTDTVIKPLFVRYAQALTGAALSD